MIEVILLERIERLGQMGQVVKVRPGYARNFLLPQKKALRATEANREQFEKQRAELEAKNAANRSAAEALSGKMDKLQLVVIRQASEMGHLFGSVTARDVAEAAKDGKHPLDKSQIQIDTPIKTLGLFPVKVKLHPEVVIKITVNVARSHEEAKIQTEKGVAVIKADAAAAQAAAEAALVDAIGAPAADAAEGEAKPAKKKAKKADAAEGEEAGEETKAKKPRAKKAAAE
jgi:large subunit ribosomal protein L9